MDILGTKPVSVLRKSLTKAPLEERVPAVLAAILTGVLIALLFAAPTGKGLDAVTASAEALGVAVVAFYFGLIKSTRASEAQVAGVGAQREEAQRLKAELQRMQEELCAALAELGETDGSTNNDVEPDERQARFSHFVLPRSTWGRRFVRPSRGKLQFDGD